MSVLFADMVGYTAILERLSEEESFPFARMAYEMLATCVRENDGSVHAFGGDSIMAVFGISNATEDAALKACRSAMSIQTSFARAADEIEARFRVRPIMRVGVSSGIAVVAPVDTESTVLTTIGNTVNLASRIEALAPAGGCLICDATRRLTEWQVDLEFDAARVIKGVAKPQDLWRLLGVHGNACRFDTSRGRGLSPLVGREANLEGMRDALRHARTDLRAIDLVAEAGLGKTRLIFEFLEELRPEDALVLQGHCGADGQNTPFLPFLEVTRTIFEILPEDDPGAIANRLEHGLHRLGLHSAENLGLLQNLLGLAPSDGSLTGLDGVLIGLRTRNLLPALFKALCRSSTLILLLEDIQWIDSASEEILTNLIDGGSTANLLIILARRPEYVPRWQNALSVTTQVLTPLVADDIVHVAMIRLGVDDLPDALIQQVTERGGGNPLFSEEILSFLIEQGALRVESGVAVFDAQSGMSALPASLLGLLAARLDRLPKTARALLQIAAVIGRRFDAALLALAAPVIDDLDAVLRQLQEQDIVSLDADGFTYVFKQMLMRDCVYHSLLPERRAQLHLVVAKALEQRSGGRLAEVAELLAHHYAQTDCRDLAFTYLAMAGVKSLGVFSNEAADQYFAAALALYAASPDCACEKEFASLLASYALCLNISLSVKPMIRLADEFIPTLNRLGDSRHYALFLHHYVSCLVCNARYLDALKVRTELSQMAARLGDSEAIAYALVSELSVSTYCAPMPTDVFDAKRAEAETLLAGLHDAYLQNFFLATVGWDEVCRGRVNRAHATADRLMAAGTAMSDPRSLGYGTAMRALIASVTDDHEQALEMSALALGVSRAKFEQAIASAAGCSAKIILRKPGAVEDVQGHLDTCTANGWRMFQAGPELMLGVAQVLDGQIGKGLTAIEAAIAKNEEERFRASADWGRLYLCEIYLSILSREGSISTGVMLRNVGTLIKVITLGAGRIARLIEQVRSSQQFDPNGHNIGRTEMILGLLHKLKKNRVLAERHLTEARRIIGASGASPLLTRIETALAAV